MTARLLLTSYVGGTSLQQMANTISTGVRPGKGGMPSYKHLSDSDRLALAAWVGELQRR